MGLGKSEKSPSHKCSDVEVFNVQVPENFNETTNVVSCFLSLVFSHCCITTFKIKYIK